MATQTGSFGSSDGRGKLLKDSAVVVAVLTTFGGIAVAAINVLPKIMEPDHQASSEPLPKTVEWSPYGEVEHVKPDGSEISVTGISAKDVEGLVVGIGPRPGGEYWTAPATVANGEWTAVVTTDSGLPSDYKMKVWYRIRPSESKGAGLTFRLDPPPPSPSPSPSSPADIAACAAQHGDACFNQPGWQQPSVYQGG
jgi:hypothetical protein